MTTPANIERIQDVLHDYLAPHPQLGTDEDERGCVPCFLIARHLDMSLPQRFLLGMPSVEEQIVSQNRAIAPWVTAGNSDYRDLPAPSRSRPT